MHIVKKTKTVPYETVNDRKWGSVTLTANKRHVKHVSRADKM